MFTSKTIVRVFTASMVIFSLLMFAFSSVTQVHAQAQPQEAGPTPSVDIPDGISPADWVQINAILPANQQAYIKASNTGSSDNFGPSIALSGDTLVVGAYAEDSNATGVNGNQADNSATDSGAVYIFTRSGSTWSQQAYLKASNTEAGDWFGDSVAISGDTLVVGAPGEGSNATGVNGNQANNSASHSGAVYVFTRSGTTWSQQAYIKASNTEAEDVFGRPVKIDGNTLVVGASYEDSNAMGVNGNQANNSAGYAGAAYVFTRSGTTWSQQAYLKASNTNANDFFGGALAISGDTIAVGAHAEASSATGINGANNNAAALAGAVYVFTRTGTVWSQQAYVKASNTDAGDLFGTSVGIYGNTLVVGAYGESSNATGINGNQGDNSAGASGAVYVFTRAGTTWSQQAYLKALNTNAGDEFGGGVAISDSKIVVGAKKESSNATGVNGNQADNSAQYAGAAYVFTRAGSTWSQQAYLKASNTEANDSFGSVAIAGDTVVVGAIYEDGNATGINGNQANNSAADSGAVYAFSLTLPTALASQRTNVNPTTAASVTYRVTFSEPVTGVDLSDFGLVHSSQMSGTSLIGVSGGPTVYTVTVNTGTGSGALRLNLYDNDSIVNASNVPLGGDGIGNGNLITGETYIVRPLTQTFQSQAAQDGWLLESNETSSIGGSMDSAAPLFYVGDDAGNKQIRAMLHFETGSLPDTAVITAATLKLINHSVVGTNPFGTLGNLRVETSKAYFGTAPALQVSDFEAEPAAPLAGVFNPTPVGTLYSAVFNDTGKVNINLTGSTQFRLRFLVDDNNNLTADYLRFFSGNVAIVSNQPALVVQYYVP